MKVLKGINRGLLKFMDVLSIVLMIGMVLFLFIQLVARAVFTHGFPWTEESAKICLIMLAYIGAAMTSLNGVHINVTILDDLMRGVGKKIIYVIQQLICIAFLVMVFLYSFPTLKIAAKSVMTNTHINYAIVYAIIPICCVLMVFGHIAKIVTQLTEKEYVKMKDEDRAEVEEPKAGEEEDK